jgi:hypothetical protein
MTAFMPRSRTAAAAWFLATSVGCLALALIPAWTLAKTGAMPGDAFIAAPPAGEDEATPTHGRVRCRNCGVVATIHSLEPTGDLPVVYEFTLRMRDGSLRTREGTGLASWRVGDRIALLGGESDSELRH